MGHPPSIRMGNDKNWMGKYAIKLSIKSLKKV
jgi:hypothetical protein